MKKKVIYLDKFIANKSNKKNPDKDSLTVKNNSQESINNDPTESKDKLIKFSDSHVVKNIDLIWLFCPKCQTLQYTLTSSPFGRTHNSCGTIVQETIVTIDLFCEYSFASYNTLLAAKCLKEQRQKLDESDFTDVIAYFRHIEVSSNEFLAFLKENFNNLELSLPDEANIKKLAAQHNYLIDKWGLIISAYLSPQIDP